MDLPQRMSWRDERGLMYGTMQDGAVDYLITLSYRRRPSFPSPTESLWSTEVSGVAVPQTITWRELRKSALVEPIAVAWHAVDISPFKQGDSVLILGGGPIGLAVLQVLKVRGAEKVIVSEVSPRRKQFAAEFGADYVLDPTKEDVVARVRELCDGQGAHVAFDAAGVQAGLNAAILAIRARGTLCNIAVWEKPASINVNDLVFKERYYMGTACYVFGDFQAVIDAIETGKCSLRCTTTVC
jgi:threonine dehydrogenase-like Zn-dependent dehydrogenase